MIVQHSATDPNINLSFHPAVEGERAPLYQSPKKEPSAELETRDMFSPTKSPIKRAPRKESIVKARSASAASMKVRAVTARVLHM